MVSHSSVETMHFVMTKIEIPKHLRNNFFGKKTIFYEDRKLHLKCFSNSNYTSISDSLEDSLLGNFKGETLYIQGGHKKMVIKKLPRYMNPSDLSCVVIGNLQKILEINNDNTGGTLHNLQGWTVEAPVCDVGHVENL